MNIKIVSQVPTHPDCYDLVVNEHIGVFVNTTSMRVFKKEFNPRSGSFKREVRGELKNAVCDFMENHLQS